MNVYLDTSVILRVVFRQPNRFPGWGKWDSAFSSALWHAEALRAMDRARLTGAINDRQVAQFRTDIEIVHEHLNVIPLTEALLARAGEPFPTIITTLDAIHLASALHVREAVGLDIFLTHDSQLATAATATGFAVRG
jgi:predicted nucleic acid-binding protein